ncbi:MAG: DUF1800 family protein [Bauldia sp.]
MARTEQLIEAGTALRRFGLGARPGELAKIADDPRGFVASQAQKTASAAFPNTLPDTPKLLTDVQAFQTQRAMERQKANGVAPPEAPALNTPAGRALGKRIAATMTPGFEPAKAYADDALARANWAATTNTPYVERLTMFWSNLMCVAVQKNQLVRSIAGAYEREAIRPYVLGRFADMLKAVTQHPAMLAYLDNDQSIGPDSQQGRRGGKGLNENLARETLELHSVGVNGGYTQADVTELSRIITGWRTSRLRDNGPFGRFYFDAGAHQPGTFTVMGKSYTQPGVAQGEAALADLARHPATAIYIATKLAAHFVADNPPKGLVDKLVRTFRETDGDLRAVAVTLAKADEAWTPPPVKFIPPYDYRVAAFRLVGANPDDKFLRGGQDFGQRIWDVPSPKGWPDEDMVWAAPYAVLERADWADAVGRRVGGTRDVVALADDILGPALKPDTRQAIGRADSRNQALALLIASSEFQTR